MFRPVRWRTPRYTGFDESAAEAPRRRVVRRALGGARDFAALGALRARGARSRALRTDPDRHRQARSLALTGVSAVARCVARSAPRQAKGCHAQRTPPTAS